jgi:hypothetical protein
MRMGLECVERDGLNPLGRLRMVHRRAKKKSKRAPSYGAPSETAGQNLRNYELEVEFYRQLRDARQALYRSDRTE